MSGVKDVGELLVAIVVAMHTSGVESNPSLTQAAWSCSLFMLASEVVSGVGASSSVMLLVGYGANVLKGVIGRKDVCEREWTSYEHKEK